jgi:hypothetical protein
MTHGGEDSGASNPDAVGRAADNPSAQAPPTPRAATLRARIMAMSTPRQPSAVSTADTAAERSWAWVVALTALTIASALADFMVDHGVRTNQIFAATFFVGVGGGVAWQRLNPRDLLDRFFGFALLGAALMAVVAIPGVEGNFSVHNSFAPFGVMAGVVLAEGLHRLKR